MNVHRRTFLGTATAGIAGLIDPGLSGLFAAEAEKLPVGLFESPDPAVRGLAEKVFEKCILGKIFRRKSR